MNSMERLLKAVGLHAGRRHQRKAGTGKWSSKRQGRRSPQVGRRGVGWRAAPLGRPLSPLRLLCGDCGSLGVGGRRSADGALRELSRRRPSAMNGPIGKLGRERAPEMDVVGPAGRR